LLDYYFASFAAIIAEFSPELIFAISSTFAGLILPPGYFLSRRWRRQALFSMMFRFRRSAIEPRRRLTPLFSLFAAAQMLKAAERHYCRHSIDCAFAADFSPCLIFLRHIFSTIFSIYARHLLLLPLRRFHYFATDFLLAY